jgi:hypothetical protein
MSSPTTTVIRNNLIVLLIAGVLAASLAPFTDGATAFMFGVGFLAQAAGNVLAGVIQGIRGRPALGYILSAVLVVMIGFGACSGMFALNLVKFNVR